MGFVVTSIQDTGLSFTAAPVGKCLGSDRKKKEEAASLPRPLFLALWSYGASNPIACSLYFVPPQLSADLRPTLTMCVLQNVPKLDCLGGCRRAADPTEPNYIEVAERLELLPTTIIMLSEGL